METTFQNYLHLTRSIRIMAQTRFPANYHVNRVIESDYQSHIEDAQLFTVWRNGLPFKCSWNELTALEKWHQRQAETRAAHVVMFNIYPF
jgi:hypothetical protein